MWEMVGLIAVVAGGVLVGGWALYACFKEDRDAKQAMLEAHREVYEYLKEQPDVVVLPKTGTLVFPAKKEEGEE